MKAKPSLLFDNFSGKLGSALVKDTQRGIVITRAGKVQSYSSSLAMRQKRAIQAMSQYWSTASPSVHAQYAALCPSWKYTDKYGNLIQPTPYGLFVKLNYINYVMVGSPIPFPGVPASVALPIVTVHTMDVPTNSWILELDPNGIGSGYFCIWASKPGNVPPFFQKEFCKLILIIDLAGGYAGDQFALYTNIFGVPNGKWSTFAYQVTSYVNTTGQESAWNQIVHPITF